MQTEVNTFKTFQLAGKLENPTWLHEEAQQYTTSHAGGDFRPEDYRNVDRILT